MSPLLLLLRFRIGASADNPINRWVAAEELKHLAWRFHKQYLTWFQRAHNPTAITDDYEQGGYLYFDWENSWCQRRKTDFRFEVSPPFSHSHGGGWW